MNKRRFAVDFGYSYLCDGVRVSGSAHLQENGENEYNAFLRAQRKFQNQVRHDELTDALKEGRNRRSMRRFQFINIVVKVEGGD